jgi:RNA polymerase sigma factor (sigma-70 family)
VEASALHAPAALSRISVALPLLRLRSDEQLVALFRAGNDDAFSILHERYRQRLFAYVRQMLSATSRQDAEDVLQDVFVRAFGALRADRREINVRAWLYRVAHNRCIDCLRRPVLAPAEVFETSRKPLHDPMAEAQRREDLRRLVADIGRLPDQQRSALLMREIDGLSYSDLAEALDVTVPAIKSLLVRARVGLVESAEARDADCAEIRSDLMGAYDRGVKASGRARRHMRDCGACREYRSALRGMRRSFAALTPAGAGPLALAATNLLGLGGAGGAGAAGGSAAAGGAAAAGGGAAAAAGTATACKVAAVVCTAAITAAGGAVEVKRLADPPPARHVVRTAPPLTPQARHAALSSAPAAAPAPAQRVSPAPASTKPAHHRAAHRRDTTAVTAPAPDEAAPLPIDATGPSGVDTSESGGVLAPDEPVATDTPAAREVPAVPGADAPTDVPAADPEAAATPSTGTTPAPEGTGGSAPPDSSA